MFHREVRFKTTTYFYGLSQTWLDTNVPNPRNKELLHNGVLIVPKCVIVIGKYKLAQYLYELKKWLEPIVHVPNWRNRFLGIMVPGFYLKYAVFLISEVVLGLDWPPIFKGWWQSFMYLPQKYFFGIMVLGFYLKYAVFEF